MTTIERHIENKDPSLLDLSTNKVRDIPEWRNDPKPWAEYPRAHKRDSSAERHLFYRLGRELGPGNYADIGVWRGGSTVALASGLFEAKHRSSIYAVDLFLSPLRGYTSEWIESPQPIIDYFKKKEYDTIIDLKICEGISWDLAKPIEVSFNLINIDAGHKYREAKADFNAWSPKLKKGGVLAFNDVCCLSVDRVIKEMPDKQWKFIRQVFNTKIFEKI